MAKTFKLHVWGPRACFTRPELKGERVSYEVITPSACTGIFNAIHWKPAISWQIDRIHVLKPIRFESILRNEIKSKASTHAAKSAIGNGSHPRSLAMDVSDSSVRVQRSSLILRDVAYVIEAHIEMTDKAGPTDNLGKHEAIFERRVTKGQCFQRPSLGLREFAADFEAIDEIPASQMRDPEQYLGVMLYGFDYAAKEPVFYRPEMTNGIIDVAGARAKGLLR